MTYDPATQIIVNMEVRKALHHFERRALHHPAINTDSHNAITQIRESMTDEIAPQRQI